MRGVRRESVVHYQGNKFLQVYSGTSVPECLSHQTNQFLMKIFVQKLLRFPVSLHAITDKSPVVRSMGSEAEYAFSLISLFCCFVMCWMMDPTNNNYGSNVKSKIVRKHDISDGRKHPNIKRDILFSMFLCSTVQCITKSIYDIDCLNFSIKGNFPSKQ